MAKNNYLKEFVSKLLEEAEDAANDENATQPQELIQGNDSDIEEEKLDEILSFPEVRKAIMTIINAFKNYENKEVEKMVDEIGSENKNEETDEESDEESDEDNEKDEDNKD